MRVDSNANAVANGVTIYGFYVSGTAQSKQSIDKDIKTKFPFTLDYAGANSDILTVTARGVGGAADVLATISWKELR
jgi:hypothetical protein